MSIHRMPSHLEARRAFCIIVGYQHIPPPNRPLGVRIALRNSSREKFWKQNKSCPFVKKIYACQGDLHLEVGAGGGLLVSLTGPGREG